jgi:hypothetical protein
MHTLRRTSIVASLLLFGAAGCADLDVTNPNHPPRDVVAGEAPSPEDLESLIGGSFRTWYQGHVNPDGPWLFLSTAAFEHSATAANFAMVDRSWIPRSPFPDSPGDPQSAIKILWDTGYRALAGINDGMLGLGDVTEIDGSAARLQRARAFSAFVEGLVYGTFAQSFDQAVILPEGFVYDQERPVGDQMPDPVPYTQVRDVAFERFQRAIDIAEANDFTIPASWMSVEVTSAQLARLAHSYRARFRAETIRGPEDANDASIWQAVLDDIASGLQGAENTSAGVGGAFVMQLAAPNWFNYSVYYPNAFWGAWGKTPYPTWGMADQSGNYQEWMNTFPWLIRTPFLIVTPDERFPQGSTPADQAANPGMYVLYNPGGQANEERGVWRHSHYVDDRWWWRSTAGFSGPHPMLTQREMRLLEAEAHYRLGNEGAAADLINVTRVGHGNLSPANAAGTNDSCVPRLPDGTCGDLLEQLKWEKRVETYHERFGGFYWDSRRWGDLAEGSFIHFPMPLAELAAMGVPFYTHGGGIGDSAPVGTYGY